MIWNISFNGMNSSSHPQIQTLELTLPKTPFHPPHSISPNLSLDDVLVTGEGGGDGGSLFRVRSHLELLDSDSVVFEETLRLVLQQVQVPEFVCVQHLPCILYIVFVFVTCSALWQKQEQQV